MTRSGFHCERFVESIIKRGKENRLQVNVAIGEVLSLTLPKHTELRGEPALGNAGLFEVKVVAKPLRVLVWPRIPRSAAHVDPNELLGQRSNLQLFLDSGITVLVELQIARTRRSVQRVQFQFPEREKESRYVRGRVAEEGRRLEAEYQERRLTLERDIEAAARAEVSKGMLVAAECTPVRARAMRDLIVLRINQFCRIGSDRYLRFSVHNRSRNPFSGVKAKITSSELGDALDARTVFAGPTVLQFDQEVHAVTGWRADDEEPPHRWTLVVTEEHGRSRMVQIEGVGF